MSFSETIFLFFLALIIFGPKKLPEMARQAGKLLAELRRASNEFRSQIETEIAHLEVEKKAQELVPPTPPPPGAVPSTSLDPGEPISKPPEPATLAAPVAPAPQKNGDSAAPAASNAPEPAEVESRTPTSQASHV